MEKIEIGISACLLGQKVRYDGGHKQDRYLTDTLAPYIDWRPVCPESECGLGTPREVMHLAGDSAAPALLTTYTSLNHTRRITLWAKAKLDDLAGAGLCGFIFKSRSPSCGLRGVKVHAGANGPGGKSRGLFAEAFVRRFPLMPVEEENQLYDPAVRENIFIRIFTYRRWLDLMSTDRSVRGLIQFHTRHKLLVLSHSTRHYTSLGRLLASPGLHPEDIHGRYISMLTEALCLKSTTRKHTNVLQHMAGYFKRKLSPGEKQEIQEVIRQYHDGTVPLLVPLCLIRHHSLMHEEDYLKTQLYLFPDPLEVMLRNHA